MHLDDCFPNEGGSKECPEGYEKMAACDASKIKERVGNLGKCAEMGQWRNSSCTHLPTLSIEEHLNEIHC